MEKSLEKIVNDTAILFHSNDRNEFWCLIERSLQRHIYCTYTSLQYKYIFTVINHSENLSSICKSIYQKRCNQKSSKKKNLRFSALRTLLYSCPLKYNYIPRRLKKTVDSNMGAQSSEVWVYEPADVSEHSSSVGKLSQSCLLQAVCFEEEK